MRHLPLHALVAVVLLGSCNPSGPQAADRAADREQPSPSLDGRPGSQKPRVTRDLARGPEACHPGNVGRHVTKFLDAVNRGRTERVTDFFTRNLGWYSVTEGNPRNGGRHFVAYEPSKLEAYFEQRASLNERMYLLEIDVAYERPGNLGHVAYSLLRTADDLGQYAAEAGGKGAIDCTSGRIAVWSVAQSRKRVQGGGLCPGRPDPPDVAIACARK